MRIRGYMAASVDGYIADKDGGFSFLDPFNSVDAGYDRFYAGIGTVILGRVTYDQLLDLGAWPYAGRRGIIVTSRPLRDPPPDVEAWSAGVPALIAALLADPSEKAAWVVGGAKLQADFIAAGALDSLDLFIVPVLLGDGIRMFPSGGPATTLTLHLIEGLGRGMVRIAYFAR